MIIKRTDWVMFWNASSILNKVLVHFLLSNSAFHDFEPKYKFHIKRTTQLLIFCLDTFWVWQVINYSNLPVSEVLNIQRKWREWNEWGIGEGTCYTNKLKVLIYKNSYICILYGRFNAESWCFGERGSMGWYKKQRKPRNNTFY